MYILGVLGLGRQDVLLASFPRSGSTWVRFMLCNLISLLEWDGKAVDFAVLNRTMVELGVNSLVEPWRHVAIPRVVKTHKPYWPLFSRARAAIGLVRDPRDVMVSSYHFYKDRQRSYCGEFAGFIRNRDLGLEAWFTHYASWQAHWTLLIRYEDIRSDTYRELGRILDLLGVHCSQETAHEAIRRSSIENVRRAEASAAGPQAKDARFARDGSNQQWRTYFDAGDLVYYRTLVQRYGLHMYAQE